jgi:hypothetical protein
MHFLGRLIGVLPLVLYSAAMTQCAMAKNPEDATATVWALRDVKQVAGHATEVVGSPAVTGADPVIGFDGEGDGLFVPVNPIEGWSAFTVELRFRQDGSGGEEQRFLHIEDGSKQRLLFETRVTPDGQWALDTFLFQDGDHKHTLLDRTKLHPADRWYWVALVYDGKRMSHYIDGVLELEGEVEFSPMGAGRTSLGVRQNLVSWFKGAIAEARFTPSALPPEKLRRESNRAK